MDGTACCRRCGATRPRSGAGSRPTSPFGVGLRLSARDAAGLLTGTNLSEFRKLLDDEGLYVAVINGFPYGPFHGTPVKASVYAPDWRDPARVSYTLDLIRILQALAARGRRRGRVNRTAFLQAVDGGGRERRLGDDDAQRRARRRAARADPPGHGHAHPSRHRAGARLHLENTAETLEFFERRLLPRGAPQLARALNVSESAASGILLEHIRVCFDCCHFAVEFEDAAAALKRFRDAGVKIGRVQLSSALDVAVPADKDAAAAVMNRLRPFADTTYLHQVVERRDGELRHYLDLPDVLERVNADPEPRTWRIHFHVPLFTAEYDALGSTQRLRCRRPATTRSRRRRRRTSRSKRIRGTCCPADLKLDLLESIAREYEWVLQTFLLDGPWDSERRGSRSADRHGTSEQTCKRRSFSMSSA